MTAYRTLPEGEIPPPATIFDTPSRMWHWANALLMVILIVSGYFIGTPPPTTTGDPSSQYLMGYIRLAHLVSGQLFAVGFLFRVYWAFVGNAYSHALFVPEFWRASWSNGVRHQLRWLAGLDDRAPRYAGLNPLCNIIITVLFVLPSVVALLTGYAMLAEVAGHESWQYAMFGWLVAAAGNTLDLHLYHRLSMWALIVFSLAHVYSVVREDVLSRQTVISSMLSGVRTYRN